MITNDYLLINKTRPNLIDKNIINKIIKTNMDENNKLYNYIKDLAITFIKKNMIYIIIATILVIFLLYRYFNFYNHSILLNKKIRYYIKNDKNPLSYKPIDSKESIINLTNTNDILNYYSI